ncbi:MAG TPA: serine/threonine-protein kinase, partial [Ktedonosporobacter sp.]|nr:serine/threonine-protein kinase [Ktedonosporobacter sp.]
MLPVVLFDEKEYLQGFAHEARIVATLEHPHILMVHDFGEERIGEDEVVTYLVMPVIGGGSLRDYLSKAHGPLPANEAIAYLKQAAQAIDHAHSQKVLHRDIKPANMLLQQEWLWLSDFGIAKVLDSQTHRSQTHAGAGTAEYMAPEQAQGQATAASDRYSLAIVAYQLLTGSLPFIGETPYEVMIKHLKDAPPAPHLLNPHIGPAVEGVLFRGLAKRPEERDSTCVAFVDAVEQAWNASLDPEATVLAPWSKRLATYGSELYLTNPSSPQSAPEGQLQPPTQFQGSQNPFATERATVPASMTFPQDAPTVFSRSSHQEHSPTIVTGPAETAKSLLQTGMRRSGRRALLIGGVTAAAVLAGGGLALAMRPRFTAKPPIQQAPTPSPKKLIPGIPLLSLTGHTDKVFVVRWDPTGRYLATGGLDTNLLLWDINSYLQKGSQTLQSISQPLRSWKLPQPLLLDASFSWSPDGHSLVVATGEEGRFYLVDALHAGSQPQAYGASNSNQSTGPMLYLAAQWKPQTNILAVVVGTAFGVPMQVHLWQTTNTQAPIATLMYDQATPTMGITSISWSADGSKLAALLHDSPLVGTPSLNDKNIVIWDTKSRNAQHTLIHPARAANIANTYEPSFAFSPADVNMLAAFDKDVVSIWDVRKDQPLFNLGIDDPPALIPPANLNIPPGQGYVPGFGALAWSPDGRYIAGGYSFGSSIYIWDLKDPNARKTDGVMVQQSFFPKHGDARGHSAPLLDMAWSPNGRYLATASEDQTVIVWQVDGS